MPSKMWCHLEKVVSFFEFKKARRCEAANQFSRAQALLQIADFVSVVAEIHPDLGLKFAADATTLPSVLAALARSPNGEIRALVAQNPSTDYLTSYFLKQEQRAEVVEMTSCRHI